ncbi:MAG: hypothetical protein CMA63_03410 [Euryarchaeota archaeon]|nr:hypothetical protein [Euryarchaeota archaeon]|tara:strand:- start:61611 stop:61940 length:330 start_codon:yes stop_codon:yes gene_type:complete
MTALRVGGMTPMGSTVGEHMSNATTLPDVTVGTGEPSGSRVVLTLFSVGLLGLLALFSNVFGWDNIPLLGEIVPLIGNLGGSGIWYYLIGIIIGVGAIVASFISEVIVD